MNNASNDSMKGPLAGYTVVEFAGLGPGPFAAMMLADMGAEVIRVGRRPPKGSPAASGQADHGDVLSRGRRNVVLDLKRPEAVAAALRLIDKADALIEGFRPGVMEGLGLGPEVCLGRNPRLVYGRMTGWGQDGPLAQAAGHDINYTALSGVLHSMGRRGAKPTPAPGLVGDFGGGGMLLAFGIVCAILEAGKSRKGQVIDASVCDGSALLGALIYGWRATGRWHAEAGVNMGDSGAHFYEVYACKDGRYISVGAIEPQFYRLLLEKCEIRDPVFSEQWNQGRWEELQSRLAEIFSTRTRDEWCALLEGSDACFAPVLSLDEAPRHPHNVSRQTFAEVNGVTQPCPAPRFSRTPAAACKSVSADGQDTRAVLEAAGLCERDIAALFEAGAAWAPQ